MDGVAARSKASPKLWMAAYLAVLGKVGGHQIMTTVASFHAFPGMTRCSGAPSG